MHAAQKDCLLAEYKAGWDMILAIDNRRGVFMNYYALLFGAVASISGSIFVRAGGSPPLEADIALVVLMFVTALSGKAVLGVLRSERDANVRYRERINLIRSALLTPPSDTTDLDPRSLKAVADYLSKESQHSPTGIGRTLTSVFFIIRVQIGVALAGAAATFLFRLLPAALAQLFAPTF